MDSMMHLGRMSVGCTKQLKKKRFDIYSNKNPIDIVSMKNNRQENSSRSFDK